MGWLAIHVKGLRCRIGMSEKQLATRVGVGETTINNIESGYLLSPPSSLVEKIAQAFGVDEKMLYSSAPIEFAMEPAKEVYVVREIDPDFKLPSWNDVSDVIYVNCDFLRGYNHIAVEVQDNSMVSRGMPKGAIVLVRTQIPVKNGDIVLAVYDNKTVVREYHSDGKEIVLSAANSDGNYPDIRFDAQKDKANIIGKVVRCEFNV